MTAEQATTLKDALGSMMSHISKKEPIGDHLVQIMQLQQTIAPTAPPQLNHYLEQRSYEKALSFLTDGVVVEPPDKPECDEDHP